MSIRSRLLLFLLPTLLGFITLISFVIYHNWSTEIVHNFEMRLKATTMSISKLLNEHHLENELYQDDKFKQFQEELDISSFAIVPITELTLDVSQQNSLFSKHQTVVLKNTSKLLTALAPILSLDGNVIAFLKADLSKQALEIPLNESLRYIIIFASSTALLLVFCLLLITSRISKPVKQLKDQALSIAAGNYGKTIRIDGPYEIVELANTLNTMSGCLEEQINRLQETALMRERLYGEYECCLLLQQQMVQKVIDSLPSKPIFIKAIDIMSNHPKGLLLDVQQDSHVSLIKIKEAENPGFKGMYELLNQPSQSNLVAISIDHINLRMQFYQQGLPNPFVWSTKANRPCLKKINTYQLQEQDYVFIFNSGFEQLLGNEESIQAWFSRILRHFATDGLETCLSMLDKDLNFLYRKRHIEEDIHLICMQIQKN